MHKNEKTCDILLKCVIIFAKVEDAQIMGKLEEYVEYIIAEEAKYKTDFTTNNTIILTFYLNNGVGDQVSPTSAASGVVKNGGSG